MKTMNKWVARVHKCPGRKRTVPTRNGGLVTVTFPDLWFTDIERDGVRMNFVVTNREPALDESVKMWGSSTCVGYDAMYRFRTGKITSIDAYFMTTVSASGWAAHAKFWYNLPSPNFLEILSNSGVYDGKDITLVKEK